MDTTVVHDFDGVDFVCANRVTFWFSGNDEITEELKLRLNEEALSRAKQMINENYVSGELHYEDDEVSFHGWWEIQN